MKLVRTAFIAMAFLVSVSLNTAQASDPAATGTAVEGEKKEKKSSKTEKTEKTEKSEKVPVEKK